MIATGSQRQAIPYAREMLSGRHIAGPRLRAVARRKHRRCLPAADPGDVLARLRSADADTRVRALHAVCPCGAGFLLYERLRGEVKRLRKDPDPRVREMALDVERDACEIEAVEAGLDRTAEHGWRYSDADWVNTHRQRQASRYWLPL
jgi:hypothetical protein